MKKVEGTVKEPHYEISGGIKKWWWNLSKMPFLVNGKIMLLSVWQLLVHIIHAILISHGYILF